MGIARVAHSYNLADIAAMRSILAGEGIDTAEIRFSAHVSIAGVDQGFFVEVLGEDEIRARRILKDTEYSRFLVRKDDE